MLVGLTVQNIVLIDRLELSLAAGLTALTGETGAGKSILLDALGLALGARAEGGLVRAGAAQAGATATFTLPERHAAHAILEEQGIERDDLLILRRQVGADGKSRAFVNDQPVSVALLRRIGELLIEIEGQFEVHGLLDPATHRTHLDAFGGLEASAEKTRDAYRRWRQAQEALDGAHVELERARADEDYLRHAAAELELADPKPDEETALTAERQQLMHREQLLEAIEAAYGELAGERGADRALASAARRLQRIADKAGAGLDPVASALDRAAAELAEGIAGLQRMAADLDADPNRLEKLDDRLNLLRELARKHRVAVTALPDLLSDLQRRLALIEGQSADLGALKKAAEAGLAAYRDAATALSAARAKAAKAMDAAVNKELPPLKLEKARFATRIETLGEADWGEGGWDRVQFQVATNPGATPGAINRIASGGELARFMLALKVTLASNQPVPTLVFDEVDSGIGGATAAAVGERLKRLAKKVQVLVITHSPQVAALAQNHLRVEKRTVKGKIATATTPLDDAERREEIARMLSGAVVTDEARAAADKLLVGAA
ncbi:DNA repair protein RecN [Dongia sp.]|uniref:DNA repair protein RecN n=1 Tax=Dongia sp. TaxID=1977262 RepID=UPI00375056BA